MPGIPILMYHHVNPRGNFINITPERFEAQMRYLSLQGYRTLNTLELFDILSGGKRIPPRSVMITFDDGWLDNYLYAFPILKRYGLKAVVFVVTSWISGGPARRDIRPLPGHKECMKGINSGMVEALILSWEELREMEASGLIDIQSHTHTHMKWNSSVTRAGNNEEGKDLKEDLEVSKHILDERLNKECIGLCWPWGINNEIYREAARLAGFRLFFTTEKGCNSRGEEINGLKRVVIGNIGLSNFRKKLFIHSRPWLSHAYLRFFGKGKDG